MPLISNLAVGLTLSSGLFTKGLNSAGKSLKQFASDAEASQARLLSFAKVGLAGAAAGMAAIVKSSADAIDSMAKLSDRMGIGTENLAALKHTAALANVGFDDLTTSLSHLQKGLGNPSQEMEASLHRIGLSVKDLIGLGPQRQLEMIADGFATLNGSEAKAAVAADLFGRSGLNMINVLQDGSKALKDGAEKAASLGLMFSRLDASKVEAANDAMTDLAGAVSGLGNQIAIAAAGPWKQTMEFLTDMVKSLQKAVGYWGQLGHAVDFSEGAGMGVTDQSRSASAQHIADLDAQRKAAFRDGLRKESDDRQAQRDAIDAATRINIANRDRLEDALHNSARYDYHFDYSKTPAGTDRGQSGTEMFGQGVMQAMLRAASTPAAIDRAAVMGTRGSFAADSSNRSVGSASIPSKQLDAQHKTNELLERLNDNFEDGLPVG